MNIPFLDLLRQYSSLKDELETAVIDVMRSGSYIGGTCVSDFENNMRIYLGVKHVISCANGTDALTLALKAYSIGVGDEVITTPFSYFATAEAIASIGAIPVFCDVQDTDFCLDASKIRGKITSKTKAILPVHIFGFPANIDEINAVARDYGLAVIEDAAQAIGAEYKGYKIGNTNNIACFSFYPTKNLGAFGDAGMITTNDDNFAVTLLALREHGAAKNGARAREILYGKKEEITASSLSTTLYDPHKYFNYIIAYNSRLDALQAAILDIKLKYLDDFNHKRSCIAGFYWNKLSERFRMQVAQSYAKSCYHQFAIRSSKKHELCEYLASKGIGTGAFYPVPLHLQKAFEYLGYKEGDMPVAEALSREVVCLPIFPELTQDELIYITNSVFNFQ